MRRKLLWSALAGLVALPLAVVAAPARADVPPEPTAAQEDLRLLAEERGIAVAEAQARYGWQESFVRIINRLQDSYPEQYAGESINEGKPWIAFKGAIPLQVAGLVGALPVPVRLIPDKGYSEAELRKETEANHYRVLHRAGIADASSGYDIETGEITVTAFPAKKPADPDGLRAQLQPSQPWNKSIKITTKIADRQAANLEAAYLRGGGLLNLGTASHCTAAFVVERTDGAGTGISTAEHCADDSETLRYYRHGTTGSNYTAVTRRSSHEGSYGDLAWFSRGTYTPSPSFYYDWDDVRYVEDVLRPARGQSLCNFGRNTGRKCSTTVYSVGECYGPYCGLTAATAHVTGGGDSGGPWYWGTTAYGIHSGGPVIDGKERSVFTPVGNLPLIGVRVLIH